MLKEEKLLVKWEIQEILRKDTLTPTSYCKSKFVSISFLREEKDLKLLNKFLL